MCVGLKPEMHLKENIKLLNLVTPETQVDLQNRPEDQVLARQNTLGHKKRCAKSSRLRLGVADQPEDHNLLENYIVLKFSALDCQCSSPPRIGLGKMVDPRIVPPQEKVQLSCMF